MDIFSIFFRVKVCCMFSLESPYPGDSNEYTQYTIFNQEQKLTRHYPKYNNVCSSVIFLLLGTQARV